MRLQDGLDFLRKISFKLLFVFCLLLLSFLVPQGQGSLSVQPFLIYYGGYNDLAGGTAALAVAGQFRGYQTIIFGDAHAFPDLARKIMADMPTNTQFYGYTDTGQVTWSQVHASLLSWQKLGFTGVLLDDVGGGFSRSPGNLQRVIDDAHVLGLGVILNGWDPKDCLDVKLQRNRDGYMAENWVFSSGQWRIPRGPIYYRELQQIEAKGIKVYMIATMGQGDFNPKHIIQPVARTIRVEGGNYISVSGPYYSAQSNRLFSYGAVERAIQVMVGMPQF